MFSVESQHISNIAPEPWTLPRGTFSGGLRPHTPRSQSASGLRHAPGQRPGAVAQQIENFQRNWEAKQRSKEAKQRSKATKAKQRSQATKTQQRSKAKEQSKEAKHRSKAEKQSKQTKQISKAKQHETNFCKSICVSRPRRFWMRADGFPLKNSMSPEDIALEIWCEGFLWQNQNFNGFVA